MKKFIPLLFFLPMLFAGSVDAQSISYKPHYDFTVGLTFDNSYGVSGFESFPVGVEFSPDGMKMFVVGLGSDEVQQFSLSTAFDVTSTLTHNGSYDVSGQDSSPFDVTFSQDGMSMFVLGSQSQTIYEYTLSSPFDIASTVTPTANTFLFSRFQTYGMLFSSDGMKLWLYGRSMDIIQYNLSSPYDFSALSFGGLTPVLTGFHLRNIQFNPDGTSLFVLDGTAGVNEFQIREYGLDVAFDLFSGMTEKEDSFNPANEEADPWSFAFSNDGSRLFVVGASGDDVNQYDFGAIEFFEAQANDGGVQGVKKSFALTGETFTNAGSTLTYSSDYSISNLPAGLSANLNVSQDGSFAELSFTGNATENQLSDGVDLIFNFENSSFTGGDASSVANATGANSGIDLIFRDNSTPFITFDGYGPLDKAGMEATTFSIASEQTNPQGMAFSADGMKLFVIGSTTASVHQYNLTTAFDVTSGVSYSGFSYDLSGIETSPTGIEFNPNGTKMYITGTGGDKVSQLNLSAGFDLNSTITDDGSPFDVTSQVSNPLGITFNTDGSKMYIAGSGIFEYTLNTPFDITAGASFTTSNPLVGSGAIKDFVFAQDGMALFIATSSSVSRYNLAAPFNISYGVEYGDFTSFSSVETSIRGLTFSSDRSTFHIIGSTGDDVTQFNLFVDGFEESISNDGSIANSKTIRIVDDLFSNSGGTLTQGADYLITGVPTGLTPSLAVAADGLSAELSFLGSAMANDVSDNVSNLVINFTNSAFVNSDASNVINAQNANSYYDINYNEASPVIFNKNGFDILGDPDLLGSFLSLPSTTPYGATLSPDGTKMFFVDLPNDEIEEYTLTAPFQPIAGVTNNVSFSVSSQEAAPAAVSFNTNGSKMFVLGSSSDAVHQYTLSTAFDISTAVYDDVSFSVKSEESSPTGMTFSATGHRLYIVGSSEDLIHQYKLKTPFDLTSPAALTGSYDYGVEGNATAISISPDGSKMYLVGSDVRTVYQFNLSENYDINTASYDGDQLSVSSLGSQPTGVSFSSTGQELYITAASNDRLRQYNLAFADDFTENGSNQGAVDGSFDFGIAGGKFTSAGATLSYPADFTVSNLPAGLTPVMTISSDGLEAILTFSGNAADHQELDNVSNFSVTFLDGAFVSGDAAGAINGTFMVNAEINFENDPGLNYPTGDGFIENIDNVGAVEGQQAIQLILDTFVNASGTLESGVHYNVSGLPTGLTPLIKVDPAGTLATLTLTGNANANQDADDIDNLEITFLDAAFTTNTAAVIVNATSQPIAGIDFNDNNPSISYGKRLDLSLSTKPTLSHTYNVTNEVTGPGGMAFSSDGMKMLMVGFDNDMLFEYNLTNAFDISTGVSYSGNFIDLSGETNSPVDLDFNTDGTTMFIMDGSGDEIEQYSLSVGFDISSTVTHIGSLDVGPQDIQPSAITFSPDGRKMYMVGSTDDMISQYTLTTPFDVTSGATFDNIEVSLLSRNYSDVQISDDGKNIFVSNSAFPGTSSIIQYALATPFDLADGITQTGNLNFHDIDYGPTGFIVSPDRKRLLILGGQNDAVYQFDLPFNGFNEVSLNNGEVEGSMIIDIDDERFTNAGSDLNVDTDYTINNLPSGLTPVLSVSADGLFATLTFEGAAANNQVSDDVELEFTFTNSAFVGGDASIFPNVVNANSNRSIDFRDNNPRLTYGNGYNLSVAMASGTLDLSGEGAFPLEMKFNADGTKLFVLEEDDSEINQYALTTPYEISSGVTFVGNTTVFNSEDTSPAAFAFNNNGSKLFILGGNNSQIYQYTLSTAFDITSGVSHDGTPLAVVAPDPTGLVFSADGNGIFISATDPAFVYQYALNTAFDITAGASETAQITIGSNVPDGFSFSADGRRMYIINADEGAKIIEYSLIAPFDPSSGISTGGQLNLTGGMEPGFRGPIFSPKGEKLFFFNGNSVSQFSINIGGFNETTANSGEVEGELSIRITDDTFTSAGSSLPFSDYEITNLPVGLSVDLSIAADGYTATLSLTGSAMDNSNAADISSLQFNFTDAAFTNSTAAKVANAQFAESNIGVDFIEEPTIADQTLEIAENSPDDTTVGVIAVTDSEGGNVTFAALTGELGSLFNLNPDGTLIATRGINFEEEGPYEFEVTATSDAASGLSATATIIVEVINVNEAPTDIALSNNTIDESNPAGTVVGSLSNTDQDEADTHTYGLKAGNTDNDAFAISGSELVTNEVLDFESKSSYNLEVIVTDLDGLSFEKAFAVSVNNLPVQITSLILDNTAVDENTALSTSVGTFTTSGEDLSGSFTYSLISGEGSDDNTSFDISGDQLVTNSSLDFETKDSYTVRVLADDGSLTFEEAFMISVNDVAEAPTDLTLSASSVAENNAVNDVIGSLSTTDEDAGETYSYSLVSGTGDTDNASFTLVGNEIQAAEVFDFETKDSYSILVETNDGNGGSFSKSFTISITNENESIVVSNPVADLEINERFETLEIDLSNVFTDEDGDELTYTVSSSDETIVTVVNLNETLTITEVGNLGVSTITVTANDNTGVTTSDEFTVTVLNVNDAPIVANAIADQTLDEGFDSVEIDLANTFTDEDGDALTLTVASSDETVVTVTITESVLTITEVDNGSAIITVTANDGNGGSISDEFTVTVNNVNDAPIVANAIADQTLDEGFGSIEIDLANTFTDEDGDALTLAVASSDETVVTGSITESILTISEVGNGSATITVTADDGNGGSISGGFTITVNNVNDAPVVANAIADQDLDEGFGSIEIDITNTFTDVDGDALTLTVVSNDETVLTGAITGSVLTLTEVGAGTAIITVTANDGNGGIVSDELIVTVSQAPLALKDELSFKIYPNPATYFVKIESDEVLSVELTDLNGRSIKSNKGVSIKMDLRLLPSGTYILRLINGDQITSKRLIKRD